jgi:hypothetical protein
MLAAAATIAAVAAPAASASDIGNGGGLSGLPLVEHHTQAATPSSSPDWELIVIAGGAVVLTGVGLGGSRRRARQRTAAA